MKQGNFNQPKPFESPNISPIKERSPNAIISTQKYQNPLSS